MVRRVTRKENEAERESLLISREFFHDRIPLTGECQSSVY